MSESLRDIVSIGQLTGDQTEVIIFIDDEAHHLELHSFTRDPQTLRCLVFTPRELISQALVAKNMSATVKFDNSLVGSGKIVAIGYEPVVIGNVSHDMMMLHMKRDN